MSHKTRVGKLEARTGKGAIHVVGAGRFDWTDADRQAAVDRVHAADPRGDVIVIRYVEQWRDELSKAAP